ncbi:hypothetical protein V2W45_457870 [Cenococcum geophilum]
MTAYVISLLVAKLTASLTLGQPAPERMISDSPAACRSPSPPFSSSTHPSPSNDIAKLFIPPRNPMKRLNSVVINTGPWHFVRSSWHHVYLRGGIDCNERFPQCSQGHLIPSSNQDIYLHLERR